VFSLTIRESNINAKSENSALKARRLVRSVGVRRLAAALTALAAVALPAAVSTPAARSDTPLANYAATVTPTSATAASKTSFTVTLTNCGPLTPPCVDAGDVPISVAPMTAATVAFPAGFVVDAAAITVQASPSSKTWRLSSPVRPDSLQRTTVAVVQESLDDALLLGESVSVTVSAVPKASGTQTITTRAFAESVEFNQVGEEPTVNVLGTDQEATVVVCTATECTGSASHEGTTVTATATSGWKAGDVLTIAIIDRRTEQCPNFTPDSNSHGGVVYLQRSSTESTPSLSIEWKLRKDLVKTTSNNGYGNYVACYGGQNQDSPTATFPTRNGSPSTLGTDGQQWGVLPDCKSTPTGYPCTSFSGRNAAGDAVVTASSPWPWDPNEYGG
jgi:hypothetical protein